MSVESSPDVALDTSLKATLHSLSRVISFHASVQSLAVSSYVQHAPRNLTNQLQQDSAKFDGVCAQLEHRILRAIAVLERDALKASGQPLPRSNASATQDDGGGGDEDMMDDSFLNTSLFGDSPAQSRPTTSSGVPPPPQPGLSSPQAPPPTTASMSTSVPASVPANVASLLPSATSDPSTNEASSMPLDLNSLLAGTSSNAGTNIPGGTAPGSAINNPELDDALRNALGLIASSSSQQDPMAASAAPAAVMPSSLPSLTGNSSAPFDLSSLLQTSSGLTASASSAPTTVPATSTTAPPQSSIPPSTTSLTDFMSLDLDDPNALLDPSAIDLSTFDFASLLGDSGGGGGDGGGGAGAMDAGGGQGQGFDDLLKSFSTGPGPT